MKFACFVLIGLIGVGMSDPALAYCSEPSAPYCATGYGGFGDEWEFERCKREMESYQSDVESYLSCRQDEIDTASREAANALSEYNDAVESFNRRANY